MRVERLGRDKIRFYLSMDDLVERGIEKEDMWQDIPKVHELFNEMMEQAYRELGFEIAGPVAVEVFALPAQGMVVIGHAGASVCPTPRSSTMKTSTNWRLPWRKAIRSSSGLPISRTSYKRRYACTHSWSVKERFMPIRDNISWSLMRM